MAEFSRRRFCLAKRIDHRDLGEFALSEVWQSKQEAEPGGPDLPEGFPEREALADVGYVAKEDLNGATELELVEHVGISARQARAVLAAAAAL